MTAAPSELRFEEVTVRGTGDATLVAGLDVAIPLRGITVVAGPSGAGKSTLLRLCNRLEVPTEGRVLLDGVDLADMDPLALRRDLGMVFQRPVLFAGTVRDNLAVARGDASDSLLRSTLDGVGLATIPLDRNSGDLSGGEAQRMCLARTLLTDARVLLADEPTSALDRASRAGVEKIVRALAAAGTAVIWVTHDLEQARRLGDRTMAMSGGRVLVEDEGIAYLEDHTNPDDPGSGHDPNVGSGGAEQP